MTLGLRGFPNSNTLTLSGHDQAGKSGGETMPPMRSGDPYHVQGLAPQRPADRAGAAPLGTFRPGKATVVEVPGAALGAEPQPPVMIDAGWLSAQLWRAVLGK